LVNSFISTKNNFSRIVLLILNKFKIQNLAKDTIFRRIYDFYSKDLTSDEFERLIMKETPLRYKYLTRGMEKPVNSRNKFTEVLTFIRNFAIAFLKKLSPAIRILYTISLIIFLFAFINRDFDYALISFVLVNLLMIFEIADKLTARDELEVARDLQNNMIPENNPDDDNFEVASYYESAKEVGGDFIDYIIKSNNSYLISIGDISGKGMSAALQMVQVRLLNRCISDSFEEPREILSALNSNLFRHINKGLYLSMTLILVKDRNMKFCRAGHTPVIYYNSRSRTCLEIKQKGMALGLINSDLFVNSLEEANLTPEKNDIFFLYSDGLTETMNMSRNEFGVEKLKEIIINNSSESSDEIKNKLLEEVIKFRGYAEVHDDITFIVIKAK
jgi:sigma-B regulation protein RsbU (phosphoserine phosphatase)